MRGGKKWTFPIFLCVSLASTAYIPIISCLPVHLSNHFGVPIFIDSCVIATTSCNMIASVLMVTLNGNKYGNLICFGSLGLISMIFSIMIIIITYSSLNVTKWMYICLAGITGACHATISITGAPASVNLFGPNAIAFSLGPQIGFLFVSTICEFTTANYDFNDRYQSMVYLRIAHTYPIFLSVISLVMIGYLMKYGMFEPTGAKIGKWPYGLPKSYPAVLLSCICISIQIFFKPTVIPFTLDLPIYSKLKIIRIDLIASIIGSTLATIVSLTSTRVEETHIRFKYGVDKKRYYFLCIAFNLCRIPFLITSMYTSMTHKVFKLLYLEIYIVIDGLVHGITFGSGINGIFPLVTTGEYGIQDVAELDKASKTMEITMLFCSANAAMASFFTKIYINSVS